MSGDRWWWSQRAQLLKFTQLEAARKQAETWRTGLTGVSALLGAVLVVKGRDNFTTLAGPYAVLVPLLFGLALIGLLLATFAALRAASGDPYDDIYLNGEELRAWTKVETDDIRKAIRAAQLLTIGSVATVLVAAGLGWFAPVKRSPMLLVRVTTADVTACGRLLYQDGAVLRVGEPERYRVIPIGASATVDVVNACP